MSATVSKDRVIKRMSVKDNTVVIKFVGGSSLRIVGVENATCEFEKTSGTRNITRKQIFESLHIMADCQPINIGGEVFMVGYNHVLVNQDNDGKVMFSFKVKGPAKEFSNEQLMLEILESE